MKRIALCIINLSLAFICKADYDPLPLKSLIIKSDLIVECKIIALQETTFEVAVIEIIKGNVRESNITVSKFKDWTCASRWAYYKIGQTELLFLVKGAANIWHIRGAGNEGEMPVKKDTLYYKEISFLVDSTAKTYTLADGFVTGYSYPLSDVKTGIKLYLKDELLIDRLIKLKTIKKYKIHNKFLERIIAELKEMANS